MKLGGELSDPNTKYVWNLRSEIWERVTVCVGEFG